jgi:DNA-binding response OmpR family regulator
VAKVVLLGWPAAVSQLIEAALAGDGHEVTRMPLDADAPRALARRAPDVVVLDRHSMVNVSAVHATLRAQPETATAHLVVVGPPDPVEVAGIEVVRQPGRALELDRLIAAVNRASGRYTG